MAVNLIRSLLFSASPRSRLDLLATKSYLSLRSSVSVLPCWPTAVCRSRLLVSRPSQLVHVCRITYHMNDIAPMQAIDPARAVLNRWFIYPSAAQPDRIGIEIFLQLSESDKPVRLRLERSLTETVSRFLDRLTSSLIAYCKKKNNKKEISVSDFTSKNPFKFTLYRESIPQNGNEHPILEKVNSDDTLSSIFAQPLADQLGGNPNATYLHLSLSNSTRNEPKYLLFKGTYNPARLLICRLEMRPMIGCPMVPRIETMNLSIDHSEFAWFVTKTAQWPTEPCHRGFIFHPTETHLGGRLRLCIGARNPLGQPGLPFGNAKQYGLLGEPVECQWPISAAPNQSFHVNRVKTDTAASVDDNETRQSEAVNRFRVVSWNLLADMYASTETAHNYIFRHCPLQYLNIAYRLPLIMRELCTYQADILCLQEVDHWVFNYYLKPVLNQQFGMDAIYLAKRLVLDDPGPPPRMVAMMDQTKNEGCAIFYRKSKFELVRQAHLPSILAYASEQTHTRHLLDNFRLSAPEENTRSDGEGGTTVPEYFDTAWQNHEEKAKAHCLLVVELRARQSRVSDPGHQNLRSLPRLVVANTHLYFHPVGDLLRTIQASAIHSHVSKFVRETQSACDLPVSVIFAGDINQSPKGEAYQVLLGNNSTTKQTGIQDNSDEPLQMRPAYVLEPHEFTNWVPGFQASLDVILYDTRSGLQCVRAYPLCSPEEITRLGQQNAPIQNNGGEPECRGPPVPETDRYALPNVAFPSDHLALVADFQWS